MPDQEEAPISPFHLQEVLSDIYQSKDLLDLSAPESGPSTLSVPIASPSSTSTSIFASATSIAAAAGRRAAAVASAAASPSQGGAAQFRTPQSPDRSVPENRASSSKNELRCVEGYGQNLYIGGSDGVIEWWVCDGGQASTKGGVWLMRHKHTLFPRKPVGKIVLIPRVSKMLVLSDGTLHILSLPALEPLTPTFFAPLRGVTSIILDDEEMEWGGVGTEDRTAEVTVVTVRRRGLGIYKLGQKMQAIKEIPLPSGPTSHALTTTYLCAAIPSSNTYSLIDLSDASLTEVLPVSQIDTSVLDFEPNPNIVVIPGEAEFLVTSYTGASTMGVFLNGQGDPVRGTMEWEPHPLSIAIESDYIIALLRNSTITIHALSDLEKPVQIITLDPKFSAFALSYSPYGISIRDQARDERMVSVRFRLLGGKMEVTKPVPALPVSSPETSQDESPQQAVPVPAEEMSFDDVLSPPAADDPPTNDPILADTTSPVAEEPPSGSGLTPPSSPPRFQRQPITPTRQSSLLQATAPKYTGPFSTTVAETLVLGPNGVMSLLPTPIVMRVEQLCQTGRVEEAVTLVDEERRKGRRGEVDSDKVTHQGTLRFLHFLVACYLFLGAMFERAGDYFIRAKVDPRLVVRLYPSLRGKLIGSEEEIDVFQGIKDVLNNMSGVNDIGKPVLGSCHHGAYQTVEVAVEKQLGTPDNDILTADGASGGARDSLHAALLETAKAMLTDYLKKTRQSRRKGGGPRGIDSRKLDMVIDTTLAKLLAESGTINELLTLLAAPNDCVLSELEPFLISRPYVLSTVLRRQGQHERVLDLLKEVAEADQPDPLCPNPTEEFASELESIKDPDTFRKHALWLVSRDAERGLGILLAQNAKTGVKLDDSQLVDDLKGIDKDIAIRYLEYVVLSKKSPNKAFHEELLSRLLDETEREIEDEGVKYHLEELDAEYRLLPDPEPYCTFIADVAPQTPIRDARLKLMLFLQGSPFYDLQRAEARLEALSPLKFEHAIVLGRLGKNKQALQLLARNVGDGVSAQTFCTQGGEIIPPKVAQRVAQQIPELAAWAALGDIGRRRRGTVDSKVQEDLVMELLSVYMRDGSKTSKETAALLNAQSVHLDSLKIISMLPEDWQLDVVSSFIQRSLRRQLHEQHTWQILKSISAGQNLQTSQEYLEAILKLPPVVQTQPSDSIPNTSEAGGVAEKELSPNAASEGYSEKSEFSAPDEGSIAEKEYPEETDGGELDSEKQGGFFSPKVVDKELRSLAEETAGGMRRGYL